MRIRSVTPIKPKVDSKIGIEVTVGAYDEATSDWYRSDINSLHDEFDAAGIDYLERTLCGSRLEMPQMAYCSAW